MHVKSIPRLSPKPHVLLTALSFIILQVLVFPCMAQQERGRVGMVIHGQSDTVSKLTNYDLAKLEKVKAAIAEVNEGYEKAYKKLLRDADKALIEGPFSVMQKAQVPPSGDKHDYLSIGPYWWPDPAKPDGLPWIRRDGEVNPMTKGDNMDDPVKDRFFYVLGVLGKAYFFSGDEKYAVKANELLDAWFVDAATKMNPNLNFGQGIPGLNTGRGIGIIETTGLLNVVSTMEFLGQSPSLDPQVKTGVDQWLSDFVKWLQTSELGIDEKNTKNNHGSWYDVQLVSMLLYLDRDAEAKKVLEEAKEVRIASQLDPDGAQPHELARTKSLSYSTMNLKALTYLAYFGSKKGVDLWDYKPDDGGGLQQAYAFLKPYAQEKMKWERPQLGDVEKEIGRLQGVFAFAGSLLDKDELCGIGNDLEDDDNFLYPCF